MTRQPPTVGDIDQHRVGLGCQIAESSRHNGGVDSVSQIIPAGQDRCGRTVTHIMLGTVTGVSYVCYRHAHAWANWQYNTGWEAFPLPEIIVEEDMWPEKPSAR